MKLVQLPNWTCEGYYGKYNATGCAAMSDAEKTADSGWSIYKVYIDGGNVIVWQNPDAIWDSKDTFVYPTITSSPTDVEFANLYKAVVESSHTPSTNPATNPVLTTTFTPTAINNGQTFTEDIALVGIVSTSIYVAQLVPASPLPITVSCSYSVQENNKIRVSITNQSGVMVTPSMFTILAKKI